MAAPATTASDTTNATGFHDRGRVRDARRGRVASAGRSAGTGGGPDAGAAIAAGGGAGSLMRSASISRRATTWIGRGAAAGLATTGAETAGGLIVGAGLVGTTV